MTPPPSRVAPDLLLLEGNLFWNKYKLPIVAGVLLLVLAGVASEVYEMDREKKIQAASAELDSAKSPADYRHVIATYPGTMPAANAALLLGRQQFEAQDYAGAASTWQSFADKNPQHLLAPVALIGAGSALEALGKYDDARRLYQRAATVNPNSFADPMARLDEAALLKAERKPEDARRVYENIMASDANSDAARDAADELRFLKVMPSVPGSALLPGALPTPTPAAAAAGPLPAAPRVPAPAVSITAIPSPPALLAAPSPAPTVPQPTH
jgi:tetratricopeptide (TPR) repeat protein